MLDIEARIALSAIVKLSPATHFVLARKPSKYPNASFSWSFLSFETVVSPKNKAGN